MTGSPIAFFDVDETLVATKTMLSFWDFWTRETETGRFEGRQPLSPARLLSLPREEANRAYFRHFAGVPETELLAAGRRWYTAGRGTSVTFLPETLRSLDRHRRRGHRIVLVSGSLHACLDPIAEEIGADQVLCTEQAATEDGVLTGELVRPMIGDAKARAVEALLDTWDTDARVCHAYGDHPSDLPMLRMVGHPVVVGGHCGLTRIAHDQGWRVIPARPSPSLVSPPGRGADPEHQPIPASAGM